MIASGEHEHSHVTASSHLLQLPGCGFTSVRQLQTASSASSSAPGGTSRSTSYTLASCQTPQTCSCGERMSRWKVRWRHHSSTHIWVNARSVGVKNGALTCWLVAALWYTQSCCSYSYKSPQQCLLNMHVTCVNAESIISYSFHLKLYETL